MSKLARTLLYLLYAIVVVCLSAAIYLSFRPKPTTPQISVKTPPVVVRPEKPSSKPTETSPTTSSAGQNVGNAGSSVSTNLVNTGPGSTIGLFVGVSLVSSLSYRFYISRRLHRQ